MVETPAPPHPFSSIRYFVFKFQQPSSGWLYDDSYIHEANARMQMKILTSQGWQVMMGELDAKT